MTIAGQVVLITGASEGIGAACASAFQTRSAKLSLTSRSTPAAARDALFTPGDLTVEAVRRQVVERTLDAFGRIDILVNNAGIGSYHSPSTAPEMDTRHLFELNFFAPLALTQLVIPHMRRQKSGMIVNVSSIAGKATLPWMALYSASKAALCSLTDGLRAELKPDGIRAMAVCPGYVKTRFQEHTLGGAPPGQVARAKRFAITAEQCGEAIARGVERDARTVVTPAWGWGFIALSRFLLP